MKSKFDSWWIFLVLAEDGFVGKVLAMCMCVCA